MDEDLEAVARQLEAISEHLGDLGMSALREAIDSGAERRPEVEKQIGRARRSVDKAAALLRRP